MCSLSPLVVNAAAPSIPLTDAGALVNMCDVTAMLCDGRQMGKGNPMLFGGLELPNSNQHDAYMGLIQRLSDTDSPNVFSLPDNIERSVQRATSTHVRMIRRDTQLLSVSL